MSARTANGLARRYLRERSLAAKLRMPTEPLEAVGPAPEPLRPGRDPSLTIAERAPRTPRPGALARLPERVRLLHLFLHHEVQAAELCAWAILRFPGTPPAFKEGLLGIMGDEIRHARMYADRLEAMGSRYGEHPVRDWFWERVPRATTPVQYTALMGLGFEAGNLEHAERFEGALRRAGDGESAELVARVGREEVAHVHFAARWFQRFTGEPEDESPDFERWEAALPAPLTPAVLQGRPLQRERRRRAGLSEDFLDRLESSGRATPTSRSSPRPTSPGTG